MSVLSYYRFKTLKGAQGYKLYLYLILKYRKNLVFTAQFLLLAEDNIV